MKIAFNDMYKSKSIVGNSQSLEKEKHRAKAQMLLSQMTDKQVEKMFALYFKNN